MGIIHVTQYFIFEEKNSMAKAIYVHQFDPLGFLVATPAHILVIDGKQEEVYSEKEGKKLIRPYSIDKVFYEVTTPDEDETVYFGVPQDFTEKDMIDILPPGKEYSFKRISNPL